jgi:ribosomal protein S18 acetylase RimI-like enzyme
MAIVLRPITAAELTARLPGLVDGYAQDILGTGRVSAENAHAEAQRQIDELLPEGVDTPGTLLLVAEDAGRPVGWIWLSLPGGNHQDTAWVYDIEVDQDERGKGYGRAIMRAAETELFARGIPRLALNVFAYNTPARRLYESLGFEVTAQQMIKKLGD